MNITRGAESHAEAHFTWDFKLPPPIEAAAKVELLRVRVYRGAP